MRTHPSYTIDELQRYLALPVSRRPLARYQSELLEAAAVFSAEQVERLIQIVDLGASKYSNTQLGKLLIDLSWASSQLEGNTYTYLEAQVLIEYGEHNKDKPIEEAAMILNHKHAIEFMLSNLTLTVDTVKRIHAQLADNRLAPHSRHFLESHQCGVIRSYTPNGLEINGSAYLPPQAEDRPAKFIDQQFERLIETVNGLADPIHQSFFLMTRLPYLQPFYDANKRTSRICCNLPLIANKLAPLSFVDFDKKRYWAGMLAFYELGDERLAADAFLEAYLASAFRYLPLPSKVPSER